MSDFSLEIFIKPGCPWCVEAVAWLNENGYEFTEHNVIADRAKFDEMIELTGQSSAPSMRVRTTDGRGDLVLADFGVQELIPFLEKHGLKDD
ncbi:MAG: glutaredoxin domain-containing protein [Verrucomicrobiota bacterium]